MIASISAFRYRCLKYVNQPLGRFHVLVGPNASGKSTFLDTIGLVGNLLEYDLQKAVSRRAETPSELVWAGHGNEVIIEVEAMIPVEKRRDLLNPDWDTVAYAVLLALSPSSNEVALEMESLFLKESNSQVMLPGEILRMLEVLKSLQIAGPLCADSRAVKDRLDQMKGKGLVILRPPNDWDCVFSETASQGIPWALRLPRNKSILGNLPADETRFPVSMWFKQYLTEGVKYLALDNEVLRKPSRSGLGSRLGSDGANLPWVIEDLQKNHETNYQDWIKHVQTALPDLEGIRIVKPPEGGQRYLVLQYRGGNEVPSWSSSDGTLRLLALTVLAYLPNLSGTYLIEEPENGIHPRALETVIQSLSSIYDAQVLLATHSPLVVGMVDLKDILCFTKDEEGATVITPGDQHPLLKDWHGEIDLGTLFAGGVLG